MLESLLSKVCHDPVAWVEANLRFPAEVSPMRPGAVDLSRQPWMRQVLEDVLNPGIEHIHLVMGTQTGKTTTCMLAAALLHEFDPLPVFWALPSESLASRHARARMFPFWRENAILSAGIVNDRDQLRTSAMNTGPLTIYFVGAREPSALAHTAAAFVIADEEAKYEHVKKNEAHPSLLLEKRMGAFPRHLMLHASTPNEEQNIFWQGFLQSSQCHFYVPCPHCGHYQRLEFSRESVVWDHPDEGVTPEVVRATARYICCACGKAIRDDHKAAMLAAGEWRPENPDAPSYRRGYRLNTLYSMTVSFGECAERFFLASRSNAPAQHLQDFRNNYEALPYAHYAVKIGDEKITALLSTHLRGQLPPCYHYIVVCYDPGQMQTHWVATAIGAGGEMWVVDWGTILSLESKAAEGVVGVSAHFASLSWGGVRPSFGYVDSGDWTETVYQECNRTAGILTPTKGASSAGSWALTTVRNYPMLDLVTYSDYKVKLELYLRIIARNELSPLRLPADTTPELIAGLSGQVLQQKPSGGKEWKKIAGDHFGDCIKLARVSWWVKRAEIEPLSM